MVNILNTVSQLTVESVCRSFAGLFKFRTRSRLQITDSLAFALPGKPEANLSAGRR
jgi:hypothetical protein